MSYNPDPALAATPVRTNSMNDPHGPRSWRSSMIRLSGKNRALNEFSVQRDDEEVEENLVMLHGYGAGLGFFYKNFEGLSQVQGWKLYALDMLGMGRSTRPPFKVHAKDQQGKISEAENWFIDALEEWRKIRKIEKFTLLGHSMGGYMAVAYALKYPGHLNKLILASPVGIPEDPYATQADMPEQSTMESEMLQDQEEIVNPPGTGDNNNFLNARSKASSTTSTKSNAPLRRPIPKWVSYLWEANISPFSIVRWTGPLGPRFVSGWTSRRFSHLPEDEAQSLHEYAYSLFRQRGSGEYALAYILAPGAFARSPLIRRIQDVGRQVIKKQEPDGKIQEVRESGIPVVLMYGENDWMDIAGGFAAEQKIEEKKAEALARASKEEKERDNGSAKVVVIGRAGHHLYLDGWEEFNEVIRAEMEETRDRGRKEKESAKREGNGKP
jgi:cardiolipin-specific phospholipase